MSSILSDEDKAKIRRVVDLKEAQYSASLDKYAAEGDRVCYPAIPTALGKAQAELKVRQSVSSSTKSTLEKARKETVKKLKEWRRELREIEVVERGASSMRWRAWLKVAAPRLGIWIPAR